MTTLQPSTEKTDMLEAIFAMQAELNDYVFVKNSLRDNDGGQLTMATIIQAVYAGRLMVNDLPNQWLARYTRAMEAEINELKDDLRWKWWSKDPLDLQNIRVELIDVLHFLVSAMIASGLTAEKVHDLYRQKHSVNIARQDSDYSQATKTEDDNRTIE